MYFFDISNLPKMYYWLLQNWKQNTELKYMYVQYIYIIVLQYMYTLFFHVR